MLIDSVNDSDSNGGNGGGGADARGSGCQFFLDRSTELRELLLKLHADVLRNKPQLDSGAVPKPATNHVTNAIEAITAIKTTVCELRTMMEVYVDKEGNRIDAPDKETGKNGSGGGGAGASARARARAGGKERGGGEDEGSTASCKPTSSKPSPSAGVRARFDASAAEAAVVEAYEQKNMAIDWRFDRVRQIEHSLGELMAE